MQLQNKIGSWRETPSETPGLFARHFARSPAQEKSLGLGGLPRSPAGEADAGFARIQTAVDDALGRRLREDQLLRTVGQIEKLVKR